MFVDNSPAGDAYVVVNEKGEKVPPPSHNSTFSSFVTTAFSGLCPASRPRVPRMEQFNWCAPAFPALLLSALDSAALQAATLQSAPTSTAFLRQSRLSSSEFVLSNTYTFSRHLWQILAGIFGRAAESYVAKIWRRLHRRLPAHASGGSEGKVRRLRSVRIDDPGVHGMR